MNSECGKHLLLDITLNDIDTPNIHDIKTISEYLNESIDLVEMDEIGEITHIFEPFGITSIKGLATSHMSIHTFPEHKYISIDLYSCMDFDERLIIDFTKKFFSVREMRIVEIMRHITEPQRIRQWSE